MRIHSSLPALIVVLLVGSAFAAAAQNQTYGPTVTGSMYDGNNANAPAFLAQNARKEQPQQGGGDANAQAQSHDNKGGQSGSARAGGGG